MKSRLFPFRQMERARNRGYPAMRLPTSCRRPARSRTLPHFSIYGDLDSAHVLAYKSKIVAEMAHRHPTDFLWDFTHLSFLDSSGIGLMLGRYNDIRAVGGRIGVMGLKTSTRKILKLTGLDSIIEEYQSVNDFKKKGTYSYE